MPTRIPAGATNSSLMILSHRSTKWEYSIVSLVALLVVFCKYGNYRHSDCGCPIIDNTLLIHVLQPHHGILFATGHDIMPAPVRKLVINAAADGLVVLPTPQRTQRAVSGLQIDYTTHEVRPWSFADSQTYEEPTVSIESHGLVGTLP